MLFASSVGAVLDRMRVSLNASDLTAVLRAVDETRPSRDYAEFMTDVQRAYEGAQQARIVAELRRRYPKTWAWMPVIPVPVVTETAEIDAQAYRVAPARFLRVAGERLDVEDPRSVAFAELVRRSKAKTFMRELERVTSAAETAFVRTRWSTEEERLELTLFWPHHVWVLARDGAPGVLQTAETIIARIGGTSGDKDELFEVWTFDVGDDGERIIRFAHMTRGGDIVRPWTLYEERDYPWTVWHTRLTQGAIYAVPDRDILAVQDQTNVALSDFWYSKALNSHKQIWTNAQLKTGTEIKIGPDSVFSTKEPGSTVGVLDLTVGNEALEAIERGLVLHGRGRRQPVDAWWTKQGNPETGVAREARNEFADQKRAEHADLFADLEAEFWRIGARIHDKFGPSTLTLDGPDVEFVTKFPPIARRFEDPTTLQTRMLDLFDRGLISEARLMVELDHYETEDDAIAAGYSGKKRGEIAASTAPRPPADPAGNAAGDALDPANDSPVDEPGLT